MRAIILITVIFMDYVNSLYPDCVDVTCPYGLILLSPLSYNIMRSNVFNGTQSSNKGCTNGAIVNGRVTIDCGQGNTLIDCDRGYNDNVDYSDLFSYFTWNRTESIGGQVPIVFRFYQQVDIRRITMFFWNSLSNSIIVPSARLFGSNYFNGSTVLTDAYEVTTSSPNRTIDGRQTLNVDITNDRQFQYLRIEMSFYYNSEWIFLSEVQFCGYAAPFHITQPSADNNVQIVSPTATIATLTCSLNITIPLNMFITWDHDGSIATTASNKNAIQTSHSTALLIENPQSSDAGLYRCTFNNAVNDGWVLRRHIRLLITTPNIIYPSNDYQVIMYNNSMSSVQLMCSLNVTIPSSITVTWLHNGTIIMIPPNEVLTADSNTTLVIRNPQPSDSGVYQCVFNDSVNGWMLRKNISVNVPDTTSTVIITISNATSTITSFVYTITTSVTITNTDAASIVDTLIVRATTTTASSPTTTTTTTASSPTTTTTTSTAAANSTAMTTTSDTYTSIAPYTTALLTSPSLSLTSDNNKKKSSSAGVIVALIVLVVVILITITIFVVGISIVGKAKKSKQCSKPDVIYYSTIDETRLQRTTSMKSEAAHSELTDVRLSKEEPQYMEIFRNTPSSPLADKVKMQNNPSYSLSSGQVKMQDNSAYASTKK